MLGMNKFVSKRVFGALAGAALVLSAGVASAATVSIYNDTTITAAASSGDATGLRGTVTCSAACTVLKLDAALGPYFFSSPGEIFLGPEPSSDPASEVAWMNSILGTTFTTAEAIAGKTDGTSSDTDYMTSSLYVILKIGNTPDHTILRNDSGGLLTFSYHKADGAKGGLSHFSGLGEACPTGSEGCGPGVGVVPLPAGLPLLLSAFGVGGLLTRKFRKQA